MPLHLCGLAPVACGSFRGYGSGRLAAWQPGGTARVNATFLAVDVVDIDAKNLARVGNRVDPGA